MAHVAAWVGSVDDPPFASHAREAAAQAAASWHRLDPFQPFAEMRARIGRFLRTTVARLVQRFARLRNLPLRPQLPHVAWMQAHAPPVS